MDYAVYLYTLLTLFVFWLAFQLNKRWKSLIFNTFVLSVLFLIVLLLITKLPYDDYMKGNAPLNNLLGVSIVALSVPLYEQLPQIKQHWKALLFITIFSSLLSMISGALFALWLGANPEMVATLLPKSVTTPIAMAIAENLGGIPSVTAVVVILAGLLGSIFGYVTLKLLRVSRWEAVGLSIGAASHVMGTVACMEINPKAGNYSSIALVLCGVISAVLAPFVFKLIYMVML